MAASLVAAVKAAESRLESTLATVEANRWTDEERTKYCESMPDHPLFQTLNEKQIQNNEIAQAVRKAEYDDLDTPEALAAECKDKGNAAFTRGEQYHGMAIKHYLDAIQHCQMCGEPKPKAIRQLESTCQSNLAAIWLHRKKYISCLDACIDALKLWPDNTKACFRAAKATLTLGRAASAMEFCELGLCIEPENKAFESVLGESRKLLQAQEANAARVAAEAHARQEQLSQVRTACAERSIQSGQSDYIEDWPEVAPVGEILDMVLPEGSRQPWDGRGEYVASNCEMFYRSNPCKPFPSLDMAWSHSSTEATPEESWKDVKWVRIPAAAPLLLPLVQADHITCEIPILYVVARTSSFYAAMKGATSTGSFTTLHVPDLPPPPSE